MPSLALSVRNLSKHYREKIAVENLSFQVGPGEIVGLLGPNGAGKTTTISMLLGVLEPTSGHIEIEGLDIQKERSRALGLTGFAAVYAPLPGNLTVEQNLSFFARIYTLRDRKRRVDEVIRRFDLVHLRKTKCGLLSSGEQTRVALAKALLNKPRVLFLDEPTASLDPSTAHDIRQLIRDFVGEERGGVLWTSQNMYEVEEVCDRVLFLAQGKVLLEGDPKKLPREHGKQNLEELFISVAKRAGVA